jgi:predicted esterase
MYLRLISQMFLLLTVSLVHAQSKLRSLSVHDEKMIEAYFTARVSNYAAEDLLVQATMDTKIRQADFMELQKEVWALWKSANFRLDSLPSPSIAVVKQLEYPLHQWELINEANLPYYYIEKGNTKGAKTALFLNLHGSGPKEAELKATLAWSLRYRDWPSRYFIPQIPNERYYRWWLRPKQLAWERLLRLAMIDDGIDPNRIYVIGISEGGYGSQRLGAFYADYFAGAGPMAGDEPLKNAPPTNFRHTPFSFQTGENDTDFGRNQLTIKAKTVFDSLEKIYPGDYVHKIELQPGMGHRIDYTLTTPWLSQYHRKVNPAQVSWVWFPMDGRYRKGFYNVAINQSPLDTIKGIEYDRAEFHLDIDSSANTIILKAKLLNTDMTLRTPARKGSIFIYLNDRLVDLSKRVKVVYNGKEVYNRKVPMLLSTLVESCALYADPYRLYPAKLQIAL